jgi:hypothetical protein
LIDKEDNKEKTGLHILYDGIKNGEEGKDKK